MSKIEYEIISSKGVLSKNKSGWTKELNLVSWNGRSSKYDIREWSEGHEKMSKGITLTEEEIKCLKEILNEMDI